MSNEYPKPTDVGKIPSIADLVDQVVNVADVITLRDGDLAIVLTNGRTYRCDNDWAAAGATFVQGKINAGNLDFSREKVVLEDGYVGFAPPTDD